MKEVREPGVACIANVFARAEADLRSAFMAGATAEDMVKGMKALKRKAFGDPEDPEAEQDMEAIKLFFQMTIGLKVTGKQMLPPLGLPKTADLATCGAAMDMVLEAASQTLISQEDAAAYASLIEKRVDIIRAQNTAGEALGDKNRPINVLVQPRAEAAKES